MNSQHTLRSVKSTKRLLAAGAAALGMLASGGPAAYADVRPAAAADEFNPNLVKTWEQQYGDCTIWSGPVVDPQQDGHGFAVIGGGMMECGSNHNITIIVREMFSDTGIGGPYYAQAGAGSGVVQDQTASDLVETSRLCGSGYWYTEVVITDYSAYNATQTFDSDPAPVTALGNTADGC